MTNALSTANTAGLAALQTLRTGLQQVRATIPSSVGGTPLLRLLKDGSWVAGAEDTTLGAGTEVILNPMSFQSGYSCWTNRAAGQGKNELMGEEMWGIGQGKPPASSLPQHVDPRTQAPCQWKDAMAVDLKVLDGAMSGQQVQYKVTSVGGLRVLSALLDAVMAKLDTGSEYICPIVALSSDSYNHQSYGRTYVPVMSVVGWANMNGHEEDGAPVAVDTKVKETAPEPEPQTDAPAGRRRRV